LDFFRNLSPRQVQTRVFMEQLEMAAELDLPVIIHDREAHSQTLAALKGWKGKRGGVVHCFSGDVAMAEQCLALGFYISIAGPVTYPKAERLRQVVRMVPLDRLLIETDCPYLTPQPLRGKRNEPALMVHTVQEVAAVRGTSLEELGMVTANNARNLFRIP
ncbi:MAG: TatD family hydrolase, partial [Syntrophales bacterium]|nr:TatD family hydrolase [Syntrophales bacterium]